MDEILPKIWYLFVQLQWDTLEAFVIRLERLLSRIAN